jgi:hypothetical protein
MEKNKWKKEGELKPYFIVRKDLTVHESIILKGRKLVIPRKLRQRILQLFPFVFLHTFSNLHIVFSFSEASCISAIVIAFGTAFCAT